MTKTLFPASASATARLHDVSVFPVPPLGPRTQTSLPSPCRVCAWPAPRGSRDRLAHREAELLLRLREQRHVRRTDLERAPEEPVRRRGREDDDRHVGRRAVGAVDDLDRAVLLAALAGDEDDVDVSVLQRANRLVDALGHADELEARVVGQGPLDVEDVEPFDCDECADRALHGSTYRCPLICARSSALVIDFFGAFLGVACGAQQEPERPAVRRERELLRERRVGAEDRGLPFGGRRPHDEDVRREQSEDGAAGRARSRSRCRRGRRSPRSRRGRVAPPTGIATARCLPGELGRDRVGEAGAQVGGRDLLAGEDVGDRDAPVEVRRVGDRPDLEVVLRERGRLELLLLGDHGARGALRDQALRDEHGRRRRRVVDARAVLDEVGDQQDRRERRRGDAEDQRPAARLRDLGGE